MKKSENNENNENGSGGIFKSICGVLVFIFVFCMLMKNGTLDPLMGGILSIFPFAKFILDFVEDVLQVSSGIEIPTTFSVLEDIVRLLMIGIINRAAKSFIGDGEGVVKMIVKTLVTPILTSLASTVILSKIFDWLNDKVGAYPIIITIILVTIIALLVMISIFDIRSRAYKLKGGEIQKPLLPFMVVNYIILPILTTFVTTAFVCWGYIKLRSSDMPAFYATLMFFIIIMAVMDWIGKLWLGVGIKKE